MAFWLLGAGFEQAVGGGGGGFQLIGALPLYSELLKCRFDSNIKRPGMQTSFFELHLVFSSIWVHSPLYTG